tara:strand:- start:2598 stop:3473 length:876 start_codon:yes stop_codon:yes gene_type:complete
MNVQVNDIKSVVENSFNFNVVKMPLSAPDNIRTPYYGLFRDDTSECVGSGSVTQRYHPHTTDDVLSLVEAASEAFEGEVKLDCHFRDGHYVALCPTDADRKEIYGSKDTVFPQIVISAGFDGRAFTATMGYYRDLCQNLAMMRSVSGTSVSIRHTKSLRPKMNDLIQTFDNLKNSWGNLTDTIEHLQSREVQLSEFLIDVYGVPEEDSKRSVTIHRNRIEAIFKRVTRERWLSGRPAMDGFVVSAWEAYNAVQGYTQHDASRKGNATSFDRILLASRDKSVKLAESLLLAV